MGGETVGKVNWGGGKRGRRGRGTYAVMSARWRGVSAVERE